MAHRHLELLPLPRSIEEREGSFVLSKTLPFSAPPGFEDLALEGFRRTLAERGTELLRTDDSPGFSLEVSPSTVCEPEGYHLEVAADAMLLRAGTAAGLRNGLRTLRQLVVGADRAIPCISIEDAPSLPRRGVLLDVSRDRVPTRATLFDLVERLASWKFNEFQLYIEHTFRYRDAPEVWRDASPITPEDLRALDAHCSAHGIRLIPNQQCLGHMHRWLRHDRFRPLAECPDGVEHPFSREREPFSLCPTDPAALRFATSLLDEMLVNVHAKEVNVGCDETFDLGTGRSRGACAEIDAAGGDGVGRVYLSFLRGLGEHLAARDMRMQLFADIVLQHPGLESELPENTTLLLWGYEADHPFEDEAARVAATGRPFLLCPGTSSWQSLAGRFENAAGNIASAARCALRHADEGAQGLLITDWGDRGHLQPLPASWPGWILGAELAWNAQSPAARRDADAVAELIARHALDASPPPPEGGAARALLRLAQVARATDSVCRNASPLFLALTEIDTPWPPDRIEGLSPEGVRRALDQVNVARHDLALDAASTEEEALLHAELLWTADLLGFAARLALARFAEGGDALEELSEATRRDLARRIEDPIAGHRELWSARSRPGGQARSVRWLQRIRERLARESVPRPTTATNAQEST